MLTSTRLGGTDETRVSYSKVTFIITKHVWFLTDLSRIKVLHKVLSKNFSQSLQDPWMLLFDFMFYIISCFP